LIGAKPKGDQGVEPMEDLEDDDNLTVGEKRTKFFNSNKIHFTATDRQVNIAYNQLVQRDITS
jgi:hypothetical protein